MPPTYEYACADDCPPFEVVHSIHDTDVTVPCKWCGTNDTTRRFHSAPVHFNGGQQSFHDNTARDDFRRTQDKLDSQFSRREQFDKFHIEKIDPDETPAPPKPKSPVREDQLERKIASTAEGRHLLGALTDG